MEKEFGILNFTNRNINLSMYEKLGILAALCYNYVNLWLISYKLRRKYKLQGPPPIRADILSHQYGGFPAESAWGNLTSDQIGIGAWC